MQIPKFQRYWQKFQISAGPYIALAALLLGGHCSLEPKASDCFDVEPGKNLAVHSSDFTEGFLSVINIDTNSIRQQLFTPAHSDTLLRSLGSGLYLLTRGDANTLTRLEAGSNKYCIDYEVSTGIGSNPYDLTHSSSGHGFAALYDKSEIFSLDLDTGTVDPQGPIKIPSSYNIAGDDSIDTAAVYQHGAYLYALIQDLDSSFMPAANGRLLKIDLATRGVVSSIDLGQENPWSMRYYRVGTIEELHIFTLGPFPYSSPAVKYDLNSGTVTQLFSKASFDILQVSNTLAFAISTAGSLLAFDPISSSTSAAILSGISYPNSLCCMLLYNNELYVGYDDGTFTGVAVFESSPPFARLREYSLDLPPYSMRIANP